VLNPEQFLKYLGKKSTYDPSALDDSPSASPASSQSHHRLLIMQSHVEGKKMASGMMTPCTCLVIIPSTRRAARPRSSASPSTICATSIRSCSHIASLSTLNLSFSPARTPSRSRCCSQSDRIRCSSFCNAVNSSCTEGESPLPGASGILDVLAIR
jgi:hypothetical protein